jgi:hypothetical protein
VARINAERNPVRDPYSFLPRKNVRSTVRVPKRAERNLTEKDEKPRQRKVEKAINQKKRGGLSS